MKQIMKQSTLSLAMAAALLGAWSSDSQACAQEPLVASVCIMAMPSSFGQLYGYALADGSLMQISANQALYSLVGFTYGGDGKTTFGLPDLRGRVVVGAGQSTTPNIPNYVVGQKGGALTLTLAQLPAHSHALSGTGSTAAAAATIGTLAATTTLTGLSANTSLSSVTASASGANLTLNASTGGGTASNPAGAALATQSSTLKIYSTTAPSVAMQAGSISGSAAVTFTGNPTTTISGTPTTTLTGAPAVALSGNTASTGSSANSVMPPYLAMNYFIATLGTYPSRQ